ncbi:MAG: protein kinase [Acidimicrobiia bacterium]
MTEPVEGFGPLTVLGRGGFAVVYRGVQPDIARPVAIKVMNFPLEDEASWDRFKRECSLSGRLSGHPNVVTVFQTGRAHDGVPFLVMELCEGGSLRERLRADGPLPADDVLAVIGKMAGALLAAHEEGVLHRDVKPENILIDRFGEPKLSDFGIARLAATAGDSSSTTSYTPDHCAPEQLNGNGATTASDVYSLASTAYHLLTGTSPFRTGGVESIGELITRKLQHEVPVIEQDIPETLRWFITEGLALDPRARPSLNELVSRIGGSTAPMRDRRPLPESPPDTDATVARPRAAVLNSPPTPLLPPPALVPPVPAVPSVIVSPPEDESDLVVPDATVVRRVPGEAILIDGVPIGRSPEPSSADTPRRYDGAMETKHRRRALALASACIVATIAIAGAAFAVASRGGDDQAGAGTDTTSVRAAALSGVTTTTALGSASSTVTIASSVAPDGAPTSVLPATGPGSGPSSGGQTATPVKGTATTVGTAVLPATIVPAVPSPTATTAGVRADTTATSATTTRTTASPSTPITGTSVSGAATTSTTRAPSTTSTSTATIAAGAPGAPVWNGVVEFAANYIVIAFGAASPNASPVTDYQVSVDGGPFVSVGVVTYWRHNGLSYGQTHSYLVRAVNSQGPGPAVAGSGSTTAFAVPPFSFCPNNMGINPLDYNVPRRDATAADGAVCSSIFWQFNDPGQHMTWYPPPAATQAATLHVRYSNGYGRAATTTVTASGSTQTVTWAPTGSWQTWQTKDIPITLGVTTVRMDWSGASGFTGDEATSSSLNIDQVRITVP